VKNYETKTASAIKRLQFKHILAITGTPIENRLIDIYSIVTIFDPHFLGPLWEFSYQHCLFDPDRQDKINGYYNLQKLNKKLEQILIRREKRKVLDHYQTCSRLMYRFTFRYDRLITMLLMQTAWHRSSGKNS
jgi:SNF2 family DNA or RNA helicase